MTLGYQPPMPEPDRTYPDAPLGGGYAPLTPAQWQQAGLMPSPAPAMTLEGLPAPRSTMDMMASYLAAQSAPPRIAPPMQQPAPAMPAPEAPATPSQAQGAPPMPARGPPQSIPEQRIEAHAPSVVGGRDERGQLRKEADAATKASFATYDSQQARNAEAGATLEQVGQKSQTAYEGLAQSANAHAARIGQIQQERDAAIQQADADIKSYAQSLDEQKIDPGHLWNNTSTAGKISFAIAALLSGIGSGLAHQENMAMKFMQSAIADDMHAQEVNLQKSERALANKKGMRADLIQRFGDKDAAESALYAAKIAGVQQELKSYEAQGLSAEQKARLGVANDTLEREKQGAIAQTATVKLNAINAQANNAAALTRKGFEDLVNLKKWKLEFELKAQHEATEEAKAQAEIEGKRAGAIVQTPQGARQAVSSEAAKKYQESAGTLQTTLRNLDELIALREKHGGVLDSSPEGVKMAERRDAAIQNMKDYADINRINEHEAKWWTDQIGSPTSYSLRRGVGMEDPELGKLKAVRQLFMEKVQSINDNTFGADQNIPRVTPYRAASEKPIR